MQVLVASNYHFVRIRAFNVNTIHYKEVFILKFSLSSVRSIICTLEFTLRASVCLVDHYLIHSSFFKTTKENDFIGSIERDCSHIEHRRRHFDGQESPSILSFG